MEVKLSKSTYGSSRRENKLFYTAGILHTVMHSQSGAQARSTRPTVTVNGHRLGSVHCAACSPTCGCGPHCPVFASMTGPLHILLSSLPVAELQASANSKLHFNHQSTETINLSRDNKPRFFHASFLAKSSTPAQRVLLSRRQLRLQYELIPSNPPKRTPESFDFRAPRQSP